MSGIRACKYVQGIDGIQVSHVTIPISKGIIAERLQKALAEAREGFHARMLAALDAGTIAEDTVLSLCTAEEIREMVASRRQKLREEIDRLDAMARRLVPNARSQAFVSGDKKVVDTAAADTGDWADLADYDARQMGGDATTRRSQEKLKFTRSLQALRDAAALLK